MPERNKRCEGCGKPVKGTLQVIAPQVWHLACYKKPRVSLTWKQCEIIAHYYRFPITAFLLSEENMKRILRGIRKEIEEI